jgi:hypothetical protein
MSVALTILLAIGKVTNLLDISWDVVTAPIWIPMFIGIGLAWLILIAIVCLLISK